MGKKKAVVFSRATGATEERRGKSRVQWVLVRSTGLVWRDARFGLGWARALAAATFVLLLVLVLCEGRFILVAGGLLLFLVSPISHSHSAARAKKRPSTCQVELAAQWQPWVPARYFASPVQKQLRWGLQYGCTRYWGE